MMACLLDVPRFERIYGKYGALCRQHVPVILAYHRVYPTPGNGYPFDEGLISADPDSFELQLIFLKRNFYVTNFLKIKEFMDKGAKIPSGSLVITFDDGYADNYDIAFPLLKKHGLTATMFVTTGVVGSTDVYWFEKVSWYMKRLPSFDLRIESLKFHEHIDGDNRNAVRDILLGILKKVPNRVRLEALGELECIFSESSLEENRHFVKMLTWDQVVEMDRWGIEIGSHTVSHPVLSSMEEDDIRVELVSSKETLEEKLGHEVVSVSYPIGGRDAFNPVVERIAAEAGYCFGLSYMKGVSRDLSNPYALKRVRVETSIPFRRFAAEVLFPRFFFPS